MNNQLKPIDRHSTVEDMQFIYYKPPVPYIERSVRSQMDDFTSTNVIMCIDKSIDTKKYIDGIVIGFVMQADGKEAHLCVHVFKKQGSFNRDIGRTACRGRYLKDKVFEVQVLPQAVEDSIFLGAQYFLLSRGIK